MMQAQAGGSPGQQPPQATSEAPGATPGANTMSAAEMMQAQGGGAPTAPTGTESPWAAAGHWIANTAGSIEQPFISLAATPVQLLAKAMGVPDPYANGIPSGIPGSTKSLSVAPLTPSGLLQKAGQVAQIGTMALTPEAAGMTGILKMGLLGATGGAATAVANGAPIIGIEDVNPFGTGAIPSAMRQGALFGSILGGLGNVARMISGTEKLAAGVDPAMENELAQTRPSTLGTYINAAKESASDFHAPTVDDVLNGDLTKGLNILTKKVIPAAGTAIDDARKAAGNAAIITTDDTGNAVATGANAVDTVADDINEHMQNITGHQFSSYGSGAESGLKINNYNGASTAGLSTGDSTIEALPGRSIELSSSDQKALEYIHTQLQTLQESPTVQTASDVLKNLDSKIDWERPQFGAGSSPVDAMLRYARGAINRTIAPAAPDLAAANEQWGTLMDIKNSVAKGAGADLNHLDLLARRTLYSGQSGKAQSVLDGLFNAVKPYLPEGEESYTTKSIIARFARDTFGGKTGQTGFAQGMSSGDVAGTASGYTSRIVGAALRAGKRALAPDPEQYAMSIAKGEPYSFVPFTHKIDEFLDSPSSEPWLESFKSGLQNMGVSSRNVGQAAKDALRAMMFQNLMQSAAGSGKQGAPAQRQLTP